MWRERIYLVIDMNSSWLQVIAEENEKLIVTFGHKPYSERMDKIVGFCQIVDRCCGLDVHKKVIVTTVEGTGIVRETREFSLTMRTLTELKEWLLSLGV